MKDHPSDQDLYRAFEEAGLPGPSAGAFDRKAWEVNWRQRRRRRQAFWALSAAIAAGIGAIGLTSVLGTHTRVSASLAQRDQSSWSDLWRRARHQLGEPISAPKTVPGSDWGAPRLSRPVANSPSWQVRLETPTGRLVFFGQAVKPPVAASFAQEGSVPRNSVESALPWHPPFDERVPKSSVLLPSVHLVSGRVSVSVKGPSDVAAKTARELLTRLKRVSSQAVWQATMVSESQGYWLVEIDWVMPGSRIVNWVGTRQKSASLDRVMALLHHWHRVDAR